MYEARQNKEKVSRTIDRGSGVRQRVQVRDVSDMLQHKPFFIPYVTHLSENPRQPVVQLYRSMKDHHDTTMYKTTTDYENDVAAINGYVEDIGGIVDRARLTVETMSGKTNASSSVYRHMSDEKFPIAAASGTATHQEAYEIIKQDLLEQYKDVIRIEHDHMDLQILLPSGYYVVIDITSVSQLGHARNRGYEFRTGVVAVWEIAYDNIW